MHKNRVVIDRFQPRPYVTILTNPLHSKKKRAELAAQCFVVWYMCEYVTNGAPRADCPK